MDLLQQTEVATNILPSVPNLDIRQTVAMNFSNDEKVIITTGSEWLDSSRCSRMIDLYCDKENEKIFYNIKAGFDIFQTANFENTGVPRDGSKSHRRIRGKNDSNCEPFQDFRNKVGQFGILTRDQYFEQKLKRN